MAPSAVTSPTTSRTSAGDVLARQHRRHRAHHQRFRREPFEIETRCAPLLALRHQRIELVHLQLDGDGHQQQLRRHTAARLRLQFFVQHALVRGVHVDQHQSLFVLRQDVDAMNLRERRAQRLRRRAHRRHRAAPCGSLRHAAQRVRAPPRRPGGAAPSARMQRHRLRVLTAGGECRRHRAGAGSRAGELAFDGAEHEVMDLAAVAKAHFELLRMRVHVDERGIDVEVQHVRGLAAADTARRDTRAARRS